MPSAGAPAAPVVAAAGAAAGHDDAAAATTATSAAAADGKPDPHKVTLPEDWVVAYSRSQKRDYYFNTRTNKSLWEPPPGSKW